MRPLVSVSRRPRNPRVMKAMAGTVSVSALQALRLVAAAHEDLRDELGWKEAVLDDTGSRGELRGERRRVVDGAAVVGDQSSVRARRNLTQLRGADSCEGRSSAVGQDLERNRRADRLDELVGGDDDDEALGGCRDDLFAREGRAPALDQPAAGGDLVGTVHGEIEAFELVERLDRDSEPARGRLGLEGGGDAAHAQLAASERSEEEGNRRACPEPDRHAVFDERGGGLADDALLILKAHASQRRIHAGCRRTPTWKAESPSSPAVGAGSGAGSRSSSPAPERGSPSPREPASRSSRPPPRWAVLRSRPTSPSGRTS